MQSAVSKDGQIELDAVGEGEDRWVVEVKWRNTRCAQSERAGKKELEKLLHHAQERTARGWFVSRMGFSADAIRFAAENQLFITDKQDLEKLRRLIGQSKETSQYQLRVLRPALIGNRLHIKV